MPNCITCQCSIDVSDSGSFVSFLLPYKGHRRLLVRHYQCDHCAERDEYDSSSDEELPSSAPNRRGPR